MKNYLAILFLFALAVSACNSSNNNEMAGEMVMDMVAPETRQSMLKAPEPPSPPIKTDEVIVKKIIKDGRMGIRVADIEVSKSQIDSLVIRFGAYYANESFYNDNSQVSYSLQIRIPAKNFENFVQSIEHGKAEILHKSFDSRDVTEEFIDLETRLENKKAYLNRYQALLKKANSIKEILDIEEKIRALEEELESTQGRLNYLNTQVAYSTLSLEISKPKDFSYKPEVRSKFSEKLKQSLTKGWFGFVDFMLVLVRLWPFAIIAAVVIYVWRKRRTKKKK